MKGKRKARPGIMGLERVAILMNESDNVAVARKPVRQNSLVSHKGDEIRISDFIPKGHRFALTDIPKGDLLMQYGYPFGISKGIPRGRLITVKKVDTYRSDDYEAMVRGLEVKKYAPSKRTPLLTDGNRTFMGYARRDGRVGTRNYYLIAPVSLCAGDVAVKTANLLNDNPLLKRRYRNIDGIVAASHTEGCGCNDGEIINRLMLTLKNTMTHPNVGGVLIIDLGCEKTNCRVVSEYLGKTARYGKPVDYLSIQSLGGTRKALDAAKRTVLSRLKEVNFVKRRAFPLKHLVIGTECGASDSFSGITANPVIGAAVDKVIYSGGAAILSEIPEMIGAEKVLISRMKSRKVASKFISIVNKYKTLAGKLGVSIDGNFVAGNVEGGLVNLTLKSLGAVLKGGSTGIVDCLDYSEQIRRRGLNIMDGPGNDLESMTGVAASGANIILFSTGMGTTEGNLIVPSIKISTRTEIYEKMSEDMDFDAGRLLNGSTTVDDLSEGLLDMVINVASGREKTWSERWEKRSFQVWTAGKLSL